MEKLRYLYSKIYDSNIKEATASSLEQLSDFLNIGWEQCISALRFAECIFIITNNPTNLLVLNGPAYNGIVFNVNDEYGFYDAIDKTNEYECR